MAYHSQDHHHPPHLAHQHPHPRHSHHPHPPYHHRQAHPSPLPLRRPSYPPSDPPTNASHDDHPGDLPGVQPTHPTRPTQDESPQAGGKSDARKAQTSSTIVSPPWSVPPVSPVPPPASDSSAPPSALTRQLMMDPTALQAVSSHTRPTGPTVPGGPVPETVPLKDEVENARPRRQSTPHPLTIRGLAAVQESLNRPSGGWAAPGDDMSQEKEQSLNEWATSVLPACPPNSHHGLYTCPTTTPYPASSPVPSRPNSASGIPPLATVFFSDEESSADDGSAASQVIPTPREATADGIDDGAHAPVILEVDGAEGTAGIEEFSQHDAGDEGCDLRHGEEEETGGEQLRIHQGGESIQPPQHARDRDPHKAQTWWKPGPHPSYSPICADKRLIVTFPSPIREQAAKDAMFLHFVKYGAIRGVFSYEPMNGQCQQAVIAWHDSASVERCLEDPQKEKFSFQSGTLVQRSEFDVRIDPLPASMTTRTVFVRLDGPRSDKGNNTAVTSHPADDVPFSAQTIPEKILIYARSSWDRFETKKTLNPHTSFESIRRTATTETNREAKILGEVDLSKKVPEKDIVPRLCDYFVELCDIYPPTEPGQGWLMTVCGPTDGKRLIEELTRIPGFFVRWSDASDGDVHISPPPSTAARLSPIAQLKQNLDEPVTRAIGRFPTRRRPRFIRQAHQPVVIAQHHHQLPHVPFLQHGRVGRANSIASARNTAYLPRAPSITSVHPPSEASVTFTRTHSQSQAPFTPPVDPSQPIALVYPQLRRTILHTYKCRMLEELVSDDGEVVYIDKAAIYIGRLAKNSETKETLLKSFERYGKINDIEYNPRAAQSTYATARVLYQSVESAQRAIRYGNGAVSFGSAIKVEERKVLPSDVQTREMYVDEFNRVVPPSMVAQYSPPQGNRDGGMWQKNALPPGPPPTTQLPFPPYNHVPPHGTYMMPGVILGYGQPMAVPPPGKTPPVTLGHGPPHPRPGDLPSDLVPALQWFGIGFGGPSPVPPISAQIPLPNPSPPQMPFHPSNNGMRMEAPISGHQIQQFQAIPQPARLPTPPLLPPQVAQEPASWSRRGSSPRVLGYKFEEGVLKIIYDEEDLKRWRKENGIREPEVQNKAQRDVEPQAGSGVRSEETENPGGSEQLVYPTLTTKVPPPPPPSQPLTSSGLVSAPALGQGL